MGGDAKALSNRSRWIYRMVNKCFIALASISLLSSKIHSFEWFGRVNQEQVKESLRHLAILTEEQQAKIIQEAEAKLSSEALVGFHRMAKENGPVFLREVLTQSLEQLALLPAEKQTVLVKGAKAQLSPEALLALYDEAKENGAIFLKELLRTHFPTREDLQDLINRVHQELTYEDLLQNPSSDLCSSLAQRADPSYFGLSPILDWLNMSYFVGFFDPAMTYALSNRTQHNNFDSFNQWNIWVEPFGFHAKMDPSTNVKFDQYTFGITLAASRTFLDRLVLGLGSGYSHSGVFIPKVIDGKKAKNEMSLNTIYLGPTLHYVFSYGYFGATLLGLINLYHTERKTDFFTGLTAAQNGVADYMGVDLAFRLEGGLAFTPGYKIFIYPIGKIDYLSAFENGATEKLGEDTQLTIQGLFESFLSAKIGVEMTREFYIDSFGFVIPALYLGWLDFVPISTKSYQFQVEQCKDLKGEVDLKPWSQYYLGAKLSLLLKRGMLFSLGYELAQGSDSAAQTGNFRWEISF